jgi:hypothetical protein
MNIVFENSLLRRIFGPKREEVRGGCRNLQNENHNLYYFPDIIRVNSEGMRWMGYAAHMGEMRNTYRF